MAVLRLFLWQPPWCQELVALQRRQTAAAVKTLAASNDRDASERDKRDADSKRQAHDRRLIILGLIASVASLALAAWPFVREYLML